tara:strand:- start:124 stop:645 length:522 start_codon:yes stop_codon:yes gene_type:complete
MNFLGKFFLLAFLSTIINADEIEKKEPFRWKANTDKGGLVFYCGPKQLNSPHNVWINSNQKRDYYYFQIAKDGDFVVLNDGVQYKNFGKTIVEDTYYELGGTYYARHKNENGVDIFTLTREYFSGYSTPVKTTTIMVNLDSKTYTERTFRDGKYYEPLMGFCWKKDSLGYDID